MNFAQKMIKRQNTDQKSKIHQMNMDEIKDTSDESGGSFRLGKEKCSGEWIRWN